MSYYGDPWGMGFLGAIFDPDDLKNAGLLAGGGAVAFTLAPWALGLIKSKDPGSFIGKYGVWLKTAGSLAGGYALYKWGKGGGSWYKDLAFAAGAVLLALGGSTVLKKVLGFVGVQAPEGMIALGETMDEGELLAALNAIEDRPLLGFDDYATMPLAEGGMTDGFSLPQGMYEGLDAYDSYGPTEMLADQYPDQYPDYPMAGMDADVGMSNQFLNGPQMIDPVYMDGFDADVSTIDEENPQGFIDVNQ